MNIAIIGLGKLGSFHAQIYDQMPVVRKLFLCDTDPQKIADIRGKLTKDLEVTSDAASLLKKKIDGVSIATPTSTHFAIAKLFLKRGIPCLVEKPMTTALSESRRLYTLAMKKKTVLLAGHVERFNSAYQEASKIITAPLFIECHRLSPYPNRSLDIGVVLDLMIHDLDIILDLVKDVPLRIDATGVRVLSHKEDIANARIVFKNGCIANITASRISPERVRKIRIFTADSYVSLDYAAQEICVYQKENGQLAKKTLDIKKEQPLQKELAYFIEQIRKGTKPCLPDHALDALSLALKIQNKIEKAYA